jgi:TolA-binding protein
MAKIDRYTAPRQSTVMQQTTGTDTGEPLIEASERLEKIENFYQSNKKIINYIGIAVLALPLLYFAYNKFIVEPKEVKAANAIARANSYMMIDSMQAMISGDAGHAGAEKIAKQYSGTKAGNIAQYMAGAGLLKQGKYKEAVAYLEKFDGNGTILDGISRGLLGDAYWELGQLDKAVSAYEKAASDKDNFMFSPLFLQRAAMIYAEQGKKDKAIAAYTSIKQQFPQSSTAREADKALAQLGVYND